MVTKIIDTFVQFGYTKSYAFNFRQEGLGTVVVQAVEGNDGVDDGDGQSGICFLLFIFFYVGLNNKKERKSVTDFSMLCGPKTVRHDKKWHAKYSQSCSW